MAKYRLDKVEAMTDGSGLVRFDVWALDLNGAVIPSRHKDVLVPQAELAVALALTGAAKVTAVKNLLVKHAGPGWDNAGLTAEALENLKAAQQAAAVNAWITVPVEFAL